jgi:UDP-N-acetylmuramyl tripeptide synthase
MVDAAAGRERVEALRTGARRRYSWRARAALRVGGWARLASRAAGFSGAMIGGRVALLLYPPVLSELASTRRVMLVSGTNGKTTTTAMATAVLASAGPVVSNASGANMLDGLAGALATSAAPTVVAEVDEGYLPEAVAQTGACVLVLTNLSRDQLDRVGEVGQTAAALRALALAYPGLRLVANADDPCVVHVAGAFSEVVWVSAGAGWRGDTGTCPSCRGPLGTGVGGPAAGWWCPGCGLARPAADWRVTHVTGVTGPAAGGEACQQARLLGPGTSLRLTASLPGSVNVANAATALAAGQVMGVCPEAAAAAIRTVTEVAGRYRIYPAGEHQVRLILAKNPAGWAATLGMLEPAPAPVVIVVNAEEADGRDTSWLYDVAFEGLAGRPVTAAGDRAAEVGVRLSYAGLAHATTGDPLAAVRATPPGRVIVAADYTSFARLRTRLEHVP